MSKEREEQLERIIRETLWMARRYANRRSSYATSTYNSAARMALELGVVPNGNPDGTWWADDGNGKEFTGLSEEEYGQLQEAIAKYGNDY